MARADHERWLPVTRIALTDILHALSDEERSEITRGIVVPRQLNVEDPAGNDPLTRIHDERIELTATLQTWAAFLAASADVQKLMIHVAQIAGLLDELRDSIVELERTGSSSGTSQVTELTEQYNLAVASAVAEIEAILRQEAASRTGT